MSSVVVTGGVALWSRVLDARVKKDDRQHARSLDYEGRVWEAKNAALRNMISASRQLKRSALRVEAKDSTNWKVGERRNRVRHTELLDTLSGFLDAMGGDEGVSEITAYAAEPVRDALEKLLKYREDRLGCKVPDPRFPTVVDALEHLRWLDGEIAAADNELLRPKDCGDLVGKVTDILQALTAIEIDDDEVVRLCDVLIDVARLDIQGRS